MNIDNTQECFVQLWLRLERTRRLLRTTHKRFCIRRVLKAWFGLRANDDFIWEVCHMIDLDEYSVGGYEELPPPKLYPRLHREFLRAIVAAKTGISYYRVHLKELDAAYSVAFPNSTPINVSKKSAHSQPAHSRPASVANGNSLPFVWPQPHRWLL